jgi:hypothetical protein
MMRKYLVAGVLGAMLVAGQAAAQSDVVNLGDRMGSQSAATSEMQGNETLLIAAAGALFIGLLVWGFTQSNNTGAPASP